MYGAVLGDIIGSPYEFDEKNCKSKDFPLFSEECVFTDDTVMTLAVAEAFMEVSCLDDEDDVKESLIRHMKRIGVNYPHSGYGARFCDWLFCENSQPYNSLGNGSAMRVSSAAWLFDNLESVLRAARLSAEVTHNHPEGIKGAEAVAAAIFLARTGKSKDEIKAYITDRFGYDLSRSCDEIRPDYHMDATCPGSVPEAFAAFFEGDSFEDVIRTAVSLGGDSDTIAAIAGSIAEGFYGVPSDMIEKCREYLDPLLLSILTRFEKRI